LIEKYLAGAEGRTVDLENIVVTTRLKVNETVKTVRGEEGLKNGAATRTDREGRRWQWQREEEVVEGLKNDARTYVVSEKYVNCFLMFFIKQKLL
jgi:hypothetical protein